MIKYFKAKDCGAEVPRRRQAMSAIAMASLYGKGICIVRQLVLANNILKKISHLVN